MGTKSSGNASELPLAARQRVSDSMISLTIRSRASCVPTCFLESFNETRLSGMVLSCSGLGFELKKPILAVSRGYNMYWAAGTNWPVLALICTISSNSFKWKGKYLMLFESRMTPTISYTSGWTSKAKSLILALVRAKTQSLRQWQNCQEQMFLSASLVKLFLIVRKCKQSCLIYWKPSWYPTLLSIAKSSMKQFCDVLRPS